MNFITLYTVSSLKLVLEVYKDLGFWGLIKAYFASLNWNRYRYIQIPSILTLHTSLLLDSQYKKMSMQMHLAYITSLLLMCIYYIIFRFVIYSLIIIPVRWLIGLLSMFFVGIDITEMLNGLVSWLRSCFGFESSKIYYRIVDYFHQYLSFSLGDWISLNNIIDYLEIPLGYIWTALHEPIIFWI